jgi:hypothetical protein
VPILVRPVREQLEHDRVIRQLQAKLKRKFEVTTNLGDEKNAGIRSGNLTLYPDLVLVSGRKIAAVVEVETTESVNHLEALAQWAHFGRSRIPFHLYVPGNTVEMARRLAEESQATFSEIWSFHAIGDQIRFALMHRGTQVAVPQAAQAAQAAPAAASKASATARTAVAKSPRRAATSAAARPKTAARTRTPKRGVSPARRTAAASSKKTTGRAQKRK